MLSICAAALATTLVFSQEDARFAFDRASELVTLCTPRDAGTLRGRMAANMIASQLTPLGVNPTLDVFTAQTPEGKRLFTNVIAEFPAKEDSKDWIILVSHYDTKRGVQCPGANDGASTSGLLIAFARLLASGKTSCAVNIALMWLDGEECFERYSENDGLWGSRYAAAKLAKSARGVRAVICLDMLGDADLDISIPYNSTPSLAACALRAAKNAGIEHRVHKMRELVKDDHLPFLREGFPAIDLIDFEYGSEPGLNDYWHTRYDTMAHVSEDSLCISGRLVANMIEELQN